MISAPSCQFRGMVRDGVRGCQFRGRVRDGVRGCQFRGMVRDRVRGCQFRGRVRDRVRVKCFVVTRGHKGLDLGLEEVFVFHSKSENSDRAVDAVESVSELDFGLGLGLGLGLHRPSRLGFALIFSLAGAQWVHRFFSSSCAES